MLCCKKTASSRSIRQVPAIVRFCDCCMNTWSAAFVPAIQWRSACNYPFNRRRLLVSEKLDVLWRDLPGSVTKSSLLFHGILGKLRQSDCCFRGLDRFQSHRLIQVSFSSVWVATCQGYFPSVPKEPGILYTNGEG